MKNIIIILDCFVAPLLAMTHCNEAKQNKQNNIITK
jgi:hypothetical protein